MQCDRHLTSFRWKIYAFRLCFCSSLVIVTYIRNYRYPLLFYVSLHVKKNAQLRRIAKLGRKQMRASTELNNGILVSLVTKRMATVTRFSTLSAMSALATDSNPRLSSLTRYVMPIIMERSLFGEIRPKFPSRIQLLILRLSAPPAIVPSKNVIVISLKSIIYGL